MNSFESLPPEFSLDVLRERYPDLAALDDEALRIHYRDHGKAEGRIASKVALRSDFLALIDHDAQLLEIGPYCSPVFSGPNVRFLDAYDAPTLQRLAVAAGLDPSNCPGEIHYTNGLGEIAGQNFELVFSSHSIEHQPDLVRHLNEVAAALRPGGAYWMIIPDKRFCFDRHLAETTLADVLGAYLEKRTRHQARAVLDYIVLQDHNDPVAHWEGRHGDVSIGTMERLAVAMEHFEQANGNYIDVHAWQLTPDKFREILAALKRLNLTPFSKTKVYDTPYGHFEFMAVLSKEG